MFITTCIDYGETCDGHVRFLEAYANCEAALTDVLADMKSVAAKYDEADAIVDKAKLEVWASPADVGVNGAVWDILEVPEIT